MSVWILVEMDCYRRIFISSNGGQVIVEAKTQFCFCLSHILFVTTFASDKVDDVFTFTSDVISDLMSFISYTAVEGGGVDGILANIATPVRSTSNKTIG